MRNAKQGLRSRYATAPRSDLTAVHLPFPCTPGHAMRTQFGRILKRANIDAWPKPWQNLRSTRETELAERFPLHVVCEWIGNSRPVALEHYLQVTDGHFKQATTEEAQNPAQCAHEPGCTEREAETETPAFPEEHEGLRDYTSVQVGARGFEPRTSSLSGTRSKPTELCARRNVLPITEG